MQKISADAFLDVSRFIVERLSGLSLSLAIMSGHPAFRLVHWCTRSLLMRLHFDQNLKLNPNYLHQL